MTEPTDRAIKTRVDLAREIVTTFAEKRARDRDRRNKTFTGYFFDGDGDIVAIEGLDSDILESAIAEAHAQSDGSRSWCIGFEIRRNDNGEMVHRFFYPDVKEVPLAWFDEPDAE